MSERNGGAVTIRLAVKDAEKVRQALAGMGRDGASALKQLGDAAKTPNRGLVALSDVMGDLRGRAEGMAASLGPAGLALSRLGPGGLVAGVAIFGTIAAIKGATASLVELKGEAARASIDVEPFQELKYAAEQSRVSVDALSNGVKELQLRADEFVVTGQGAAAEAFKRLGYSAADLRTKLRDPAALLQEIIERTKGLDRAAQVRVLDEIFGGTAAEEFQKFLAASARSIAELRGEARDVGAVLDREFVERAAVIDAQFKRIADTIEYRLKGAIVGTAVALSDLSERFADVDEASGDELRRRFADLFDERNALLDEASRLKQSAGDPQTDHQLIRIEERLEQLRDLERQYNDAFDRMLERRAAAAATELTVTAGTPDRLAGLDDDFQTKLRQMIADAAAEGLELGISSGLRSTEQQARLWAEALQKYGSPAEARKHVAPPGTSKHEKGEAADITFGSQAAREWAAANAAAYGLGFPVATETPLGGPAAGHSHAHIEEVRGDAKVRDEAAEAAKRQVEAIAGVMDALRFEHDQLGRTAEQQELYSRLKEAGVTLESETGQAIEASVRALYAKKTALEAATEAQKKAAEQAEAFNEISRDIGRDALGGFLHDLKDGASGAEAFANVLDRLSDRLLDLGVDAIFAKDGLGQLLATGGQTSSGGGLWSWLAGGLGSLGSGGGTATGAPLNLLPTASPSASEELARMSAMAPLTNPSPSRATAAASPPRTIERTLAGAGAGVRFEVIDQRSGGADIERRVERDADGLEVVRAIVRDGIETYDRDVMPRRVPGVMAAARRSGKFR